MNTARLPASYVPVRKIDLQKNIRQAILVNAGCLVLLILMILIGCLFSPCRHDFLIACPIVIQRAHHVSRPCGLYAPSRMDPRLFMKKNSAA